MADDSSQEKTEEPTSKRLDDAKKKGQIQRSKDFNTSIILIVSAVFFIMLGPYLGEQIMSIMKKALTFKKDILLTPGLTLHFVMQLSLAGIYIITPFLFVLFITALVGPIILGGWSFNTGSLLPKPERLNILKGLAKMVSVRSLVELLKAFFKFSIVLVVGLVVIKSKFHELMSLGSLPLMIAIGKAMVILAWGFLVISCGLIIIAAVDVPYQLWEHARQLKMSLQEIKDEYKETEGKPEVKGKIRQMQQEVAQRRMMQEVPEADVILTNPTHYSIALKYDEDKGGAPTLIAKGKDLIAMQINKIAKGNDIPILQLPPLARAIYFSTEIHDEIPHGLYIAVAQVLAYIFQLRRKDDIKNYEKKPSALTDLPIPDEYQVDGEGE